MAESAVIKGAASFALESVINISMRGLTLATKFLLAIYLAKALPPEQLGVYGLFVATISYSLYLLGLDFYTYAQREMFSRPIEAWGGIIRCQFTFYALVYLLVLPLLLLVFFYGWLPWRLIGWFYLILTLEHLSQELCRLLVACGKVLLANVTLFFRGGAWIIAVVLLFTKKPDVYGLELIWAGWSTGVTISIVIALMSVRHLIGSRRRSSDTMNWHWIRKGMKVAAQFMIGTLALRGLFTFDRYFLDMYCGKSLVGVYTFFFSIANAVMGFADAGVISRLYPRVVSSYRTGKKEEYKMYLRQLGIGISALFLIFFLGLFVTLKPLLKYIGRQEYIQHVSTFWVLVAAMGIYALGMVPHYDLYARGGDRAIAIASLLAVSVFLVAAFFLTPHFNLLGVAISVLVGVICLGSVKAAFGFGLSTHNPS